VRAKAIQDIPVFLAAQDIELNSKGIYPILNASPRPILIQNIKPPAI
jgi:hypothetical protein